MRYIVNLGWRETYEFTDSQTAMSFAEIAITHSTDPERKVEIEIVPDNIDEEVTAAVVEAVAAELEERDG